MSHVFTYFCLNRIISRRLALCLLLLVWLFLLFSHPLLSRWPTFQHGIEMTDRDRFCRVLYRFFFFPLRLCLFERDRLSNFSGSWHWHLPINFEVILEQFWLIFMAIFPWSCQIQQLDQFYRFLRSTWCMGCISCELEHLSCIVWLWLRTYL